MRFDVNVLIVEGIVVPVGLHTENDQTYATRTKEEEEYLRKMQSKSFRKPHIPDFLDRITQNVYNKSHKNLIWCEWVSDCMCVVLFSFSHHMTIEFMYGNVCSLWKEAWSCLGKRVK